MRHAHLGAAGSALVVIADHGVDVVAEVEARVEDPAPADHRRQAR
jgi:hypothetical protein